MSDGRQTNVVRYWDNDSELRIGLSICRANQTGHEYFVYVATIHSYLLYKVMKIKLENIFNSLYKRIAIPILKQQWSLLATGLLVYLLI